MDFDFRPSQNKEFETEIETDDGFDFRPSQFDFSEEPKAVAPNNVVNETIEPNPMQQSFGNTLKNMEQSDQRGMFEPKPVLDNAGFPIDINRPIVFDDQGNAQTEMGMTIDAAELGYPFKPGQRFVNIPTVIDGVPMSSDAALQLTKEKINNNTLDASQFPMFDSAEKATAGSIDRSNKIAEIRKDDIEKAKTENLSKIKKATKQNLVDNEIERLTKLYGSPRKNQENLNRNSQSSGVGGTYNNFYLTLPMGKQPIDNETAIKMIAESNISEGEYSNLPNAGLFGDLTRGFIRSNKVMALLTSNFGLMDLPSAIKMIGELDRITPPQSEDVKAGLKEITESNWKNVLSAIKDNPGAVLSVVAESLPLSLSSLATFITGTAVTGNPLVGAAGGGVVTFGTIYTDTILEELRKTGVDLSDDKAVYNTLTNVEFYDKARKSAIAYGLPIAVFDALSMGLAGKLVAPAIKSGASTPKIAALSAAELANQGFLGGAGEFAGQFTQSIFGLRDKINAGEIALEFFAELPLGSIEVGTNVATSIKNNQADAEFDSEFDKASQGIALDTAINNLSPDNAQLNVIPDNVDDIDFRSGLQESQTVDSQSSVVAQSENQTTETPVVETPVDTPVETPKPRPETIKIDPEPKPVETTEVEELQTKDTSKQVNVIGDFSGKFEKIRTPGSEKELDVAYLVVDANKLKQATGDFQPRDRDLKESDTLVIDRASNLDPKQLFESPTTNTGAPIISKNGTIISGNGRVLSLKKAKADYPEQWNKYITSLDEYTNEKFSARSDELPILVRVLYGDLTNQEIIEIADLSNRDTGASMNATEKAQRDSKAMGTDLVVQFKGGDITSLENKAFVNQFIQKVVTPNEQGNMSRDGQLTREGVQRIQNAILASAYEDTNALATMLDSTDDNIKAISNAMLSAAPKFAQLKSNIASGQVEAKYDITPQITDMAQRISTARRDGTAISDILNQGDMLAEIDPLVKMLIKGIYNEKLTRAKSQKFMTEFLNAYVEESSKKQTGGMFEDDTTVGEVIELARSKADGQQDPTLFERSADGSSQRTTKSSQQKQRASTKRSSARTEERVGKQEELKDAAVEPNREIASRSDITEAIIVENKDSYKNQRVEKPGTLVDKLAERNKTALIFSAFEAAGVDPDIAVNLPIERQYQILQKMFVDQFGMKQVTKSSDKNTKDAVDQLLTGFHNLSALANFFGLPYKAIGLEGTLTFDMVERYNAYGSYAPGSKTITIPRRVNSFAHEWFHALDHYIFQKFGVLTEEDIFGGRLMSQAVRKDGSKAVLPDAPKNLKEAYTNLVRAMFQDKAVEAQKLIEIDNEISRISKKKPEAKKIQTLLKRKENILGGKASAKTVDKTQFRKDAEFFAPIYGQSKDYWASPHEMFARVGEAFTTYKMNLAKMDADFLSKTNEGYLTTLEQLGVTKEGLQNSANVAKILDSRMALTFPKEQERMEIFGAMQNLIDAISHDTALGLGEKGKTLSEETRIDVRKLYEIPKERSESLMQEQMRVMNEAKLFNNRQKDRQKELNKEITQKKLRTRLYETIEDAFFGQFFYQKQGVLKSIIKRYPRNRQMQYLFQNLGTQAGGKLQSKVPGDNFANATVRQARLFSFQLTSIIERNKINEMSADDRKLLRMILTSQDTFDSASPQVKKAAGQLRGLLNGIYEYIRNSGLNIGYAESGYMQRVLDMEMVNARPFKFQKQAAKAYEIIFVNEVGNLNPTNEKQMLAVVKFIQESKLGITSKEEFINFVTSKEYRAIVDNMATIKRLKKKERDTSLDDKEQQELEKAEENLQNAISEISEMYETFYADMKFAYGDVSATNWKNTLYEKQVGVALDAPPTSNFTKKRTLPPETDALLDEFYVSDPVENIISYVMGATRRAEYNRRFGAQKIPVEDSEGKVPKGRYNDYLDYLMQRGFNNEGVAVKDATLFAETVNLITGKSRTPGQNDSKASSFAHHIAAITSITLLVRAPIASLAEPFTAAITSGSVKKGFSSFLTTMQELPKIRKMGGNAEDIRLRQQFARILGVIDDPEVGDIMTNRIGGTFANNQKLNRMMQQFFYKTKLTGLTNAQRRTASKIGFQYISEMAHEYKNPINERRKLVAQKVLNDFGVSNSVMDQFTDYVTSFNEFKISPIRKKSQIKGKTKLPANEDIMYDSGEYSDMGLQLAVSIMRFADQTVQDPRIADRPKWAENPLGRIVYGITSFIYSFQDKVLKGMARKVGREYGVSRELGASKTKATLDATTYVGATIAPTLATLFAGHLVFSTVRELIFNQDRWDREWEESKNDPVAFATNYLLPLAFARSGFTGAFDPFYQMITGLKYRRDIANTLTGTAGYILQNLESIIEYFINNSENTLSNEYNALKGLWNLTINPILSALYAIAPMSPPTALGGAPALMYLTSEDFKNARVNDILEFFYGERYKPGKRGRPKKSLKLGSD